MFAHSRTGRFRTKCCASWAPSGSNIQPWVFGVVRDPANIRRIAAFSPGLGGTPPLVLVVCIDKARALEKGGEFGRDELSVIDVSMAAQNAALLAHSAGLGTCVVKSFSAPGVAKLLGLPQHIVPELLLSVGFPAHKPVPGRRRPVDEVTFYEEWKGEAL